MKNLKLLIVTAVATATACGAIPAMADSVVPPEWAGVWSLDVTVYDCDTNDIQFQTTQLDTMCAGALIDNPDGGGEFTLDCTSSADATSMTSHCEGSTEVVSGCTAYFTFDGTGTLDGDSYTTTQTTSISYVGACFGIPDSCQRTEITGTRIAGEPTPCGSAPVENRSWDAVKSNYR